MKIFFAAMGRKQPVYLNENEYRNILLSYHYFKTKSEVIKKLVKDGANVFVDSGAFSAYNSKVKIDIKDYSKYLIDNEIPAYAALDVIGNAEETYKNFIHMREEYQLNPIPTFHMREPQEYLYKYLDTSEYIALGGMVHSAAIDEWLESVWRILLKENPQIKIHGFGMTSGDLIYKYPWYSFDSSSFKAGQVFGRVPQFNGKDMYDVHIDKFRAHYHALHPEIPLKDLYENDIFYKIMDLAGAKAYTDMVEYASSFKQNLLFLNQTELFKNGHK